MTCRAPVYAGRAEFIRRSVARGHPAFLRVQGCGCAQCWLWVWVGSGLVLLVSGRQQPPPTKLGLIAVTVFAAVQALEPVALRAAITRPGQFAAVAGGQRAVQPDDSGRPCGYDSADHNSTTAKTVPGECP